MKNPIKKNLITEYLRNNPRMPSRTAAKQLAALYPDTFTIESARTLCRAIRGAKGSKGSIPRHDVHPVEDLALEWSKMRATLPDPIAYDFTPVKPACSIGRFLILADLHVPFHSSLAVEAAVRKGQEDQVDVVILNGDVWDCMEYSKFCPHPGRRDLTAEAFAARQFFAYLREAFPAAEIIYKVGNHEERLMRHFARNLLGTLVLLEKTGRAPNSIASVGGLLELKDFNVKMVESRQPILLGKYLYIIHGHEAGGSSYAPVNPARSIYLKAGVCALVAHNHRVSQHVETHLDGREIVCYSQGHLSDPHPEYAPFNKWSHGFARVDIDGNGGFRLHNYRVSHKGEVWE